MSRSRHGLLARMTLLRPVSVLMLGVAIAVVGAIAVQRIPLQLMPDGMVSGSCNIYIPVPDSTPREVLQQVVKPAEDYLRTIPGVKRITSSSGARRCNISLELSPAADQNVMVAEIRDRLDRARREWPREVDRYWIWRQGSNDMPVYSAAMSMDIDSGEVDLDYLFDEVIKKRLAAIDGVARVNVWGIIDKRVEINLDPDRADAHAVRLDELVRRLGADNVASSAGMIQEGDRELLVRVDGRLRDFEEVRQYPVRGDLRILDLATVGYGRTIRDRLSRVNGHFSRVISVNKESTANAVVVCDRIEAAVRELEGTLRRSIPGLTRIDAHAWLHQGELIRQSLRTVAESGTWGAFFAVVVLYGFLRRVGMTILVTLSIPLSMVMSLIWMFFRGGSFNVLSLTGLTLGVGMLVDNSIVVVENILRHRELGAGPLAAAVRGVQEVALAVTMATLTTVIVFIPGAFVDDPMARGFFVGLGEPVSVSVIASLVVALVFAPLGALLFERWSVSRRRAAKLQGALAPVPTRRYSWFNGFCARLAGLAVRHRLEAVVLTFAFFGFTSYLYNSIPKSEMPPGGARRLEIDLRLPRNFSLRETNEAFIAAEQMLLEPALRAELQIRAVTSWFSASEGEINVHLEPGATIKEDEFFTRVRPLLPQQPGVRYRLGFEDFTRDEGGQRLRVFLRGHDLDQLEEIGKQVQADLENPALFPELEEVHRWREEETEEIQIAVARRLAQEYGTDTSSISRMVAWSLRGAVLPDFELDDRELPFWVTYGDRIKEAAGELDAVRIFRLNGEPVRLDNLASYTMVPGSGEIHRQEGKLTIGLSARVKGDAIAAKDKLERYCQGLPLPPGFEATMRQDQRGFAQDLRNLLIATALAMLLVFFVMGVLFESFVLPLAVLFSVPHAFFGALFLLWAMGVKLDMMGLLGMLMLVGIVVNNAIVLVDCINRLRLDGLPVAEAVVRSVQIRFRPIWMTALTTLFGLLPLILIPQGGDGVDYKGLAVVLAGGLGTSTFFTLFVVPLFYVIFDDFRRSAQRLWREERAAMTVS